MANKTIQTPNYDNLTVNLDEVLGTDIKINPDFYLHISIINAQKAINNQNIRQAGIQFRQNIENAETIAEAAGMLPDNYKKNMNKFIKDLGEDLDETTKHFKIGNEKLRLLLRNIFRNKTITSSMAIGFKEE